jgi:hypothetical protein
MPDHDLQLGIPVEHPAEDHAIEMHHGFDVPAPTDCCEHSTYHWGKPPYSASMAEAGLIEIPVEFWAKDDTPERQSEAPR